MPKGVAVAVLVGDVGGTHTRIAVFSGRDLLHHISFLNAEMASFDECLTRFMTTVQTDVSAAVFGAAGPVSNGQIEMTNLDWCLDEAVLTSQLKVPVRLLNDFHIQALGTLELVASDYEHLGSARVAAPQNVAVIGAGTGLGEAILTRTDAGWLVVPGEGGHKRFAPKNEREIELLRQLWLLFPDHVSVERVVSGPGIVNVYNALSPVGVDHLGDTDPGHLITESALNGTCALSKEVLEIFVDTLADEAANLALQTRVGCLYLSGGIPRKILPLIKARFRRAFESKGRYRSLLEGVEVRVVSRTGIALEGAAYAANRLCKGTQGP